MASILIAGADHLCVGAGSPHVAVRKYVIAWLQRFLAGDERYGALLCTAEPAADDEEISRYQSRCSR